MSIAQLTLLGGYGSQRKRVWSRSKKVGFLLCWWSLQLCCLACINTIFFLSSDHRKNKRRNLSEYHHSAHTYFGLYEDRRYIKEIAAPRCIKSWSLKQLSVSRTRLSASRRYVFLREPPCAHSSVLLGFLRGANARSRSRTSWRSRLQCTRTT